MAGRGGATKRTVSKVVIHKRTGTLTISQGGSAMTQYLFPRFSNADEAKQHYEQQGYAVVDDKKHKVSLVKYEG